ncbi:MAG: sulfur carrier protein ThiS [Candidatus Omnitrophica bacterium]|nr:sulfur carrier protein ThiS [Candidatus Omnitrophota bacterium]
MNITINGKKEKVYDNISMLELIKLKGLDKEKIVIERNLEIISRDRFYDLILADEDSIEIVSFVGGG